MIRGYFGNWGKEMGVCSERIFWERFSALVCKDSRGLGGNELRYGK